MAAPSCCPSSRARRPRSPRSSRASTRCTGPTRITNRHASACSTVSGTATTDPIADAKQLCEQRGLFITQVTDHVYDKALGCSRYVQAWVVYRKAPKGCRPSRLGKKRDPVQLLSFIKTLI